MAVDLETLQDSDTAELDDTQPAEPIKDDNILDIIGISKERYKLLIPYVRQIFGKTIANVKQDYQTEIEIFILFSARKLKEDKSYSLYDGYIEFRELISDSEFGLELMGFLGSFSNKSSRFFSEDSFTAFTNRIKNSPLVTM